MTTELLFEGTTAILMQVSMSACARDVFTNDGSNVPEDEISSANFLTLGPGALYDTIQVFVINNQIAVEKMIKESSSYENLVRCQ